MNNFSAVVRIISDLDTIQTKAGELVKFRSVHKSSYRENSDMFIGLAFWGKKGEAAKKLLSKGSQIFIRGNLGANTTETGKVYLDIDVDDFALIYDSNEKKASPQKTAKETVPVSADIQDEDIPF